MCIHLLFISLCQLLPDELRQSPEGNVDVLFRNHGEGGSEEGTRAVHGAEGPARHQHHVLLQSPGIVYLCIGVRRGGGGGGIPPP
jgi:hypothetical protein